MRFTNKFQLPETIIRAAAVSRAKYDKGEVERSVTQLISPPRIDLLRKKHWENMENDVSEEWFSLFGTAIHHVLDMGKLPGQIAEERLYAELDGWSLSGAIDIQEPTPTGYRIIDYKVTTASQAMKAIEQSKGEWEAQQNIYAWLVRKVKGIEVTELAICAIIRDWTRWRARSNPLYPNAAVKMIDIPLWSPQEQEDYIRSRIKEHRTAEMMIDIGSPIPECTLEERWASEDKWAYKKKPDAKRATKVLSSEAEADALVNEKGGVVEFRPGSSMRCEENFCRVADWCDQFQRTKQPEKEGEE